MFNWELTICLKANQSVVIEHYKGSSRSFLCLNIRPNWYLRWEGLGSMVLRTCWHAWNKSNLISTSGKIFLYWFLFLQQSSKVIANLIECGRFSQPPAHNFTVSVKNDKKCGQVRRRSYWPCKAMQRYAWREYLQYSRSHWHQKHPKWTTRARVR